MSQTAPSYSPNSLVGFHAGRKGRSNVSFGLSEEILQFVNEVIDSFVMWDVTICFAKKPDETGTIEDIARMTGRPVKNLVPHIQKLVTLGIVKVRKTSQPDSVFEFDRESPRAKAFQSFLDYNRLQENRLRILSHLLQRGIR
jgi:hypothetical protein